MKIDIWRLRKSTKPHRVPGLHHSQAPSFRDARISPHAEEHADANDAEQPDGDEGRQGSVGVRLFLAGRLGRRRFLTFVQPGGKISFGCGVDVAGSQG